MLLLSQKRGSLRSGATKSRIVGKESRDGVWGRERLGKEPISAHENAPSHLDDSGRMSLLSTESLLRGDEERVTVTKKKEWLIK